MATTRKPKRVKPKVPRGFRKDLRQEKAKNLITERLDDTRERLIAMGFDARVFVHEYKNGDVDGELTAIVPHGVSAIQMSRKLEKAFQTEPHGMGTEYWFSLGTRLGFRKERDEERSGSARVRGMDDLQMYYRRMKTAKMIDSFLRQQKKMIPGAEKRYRRKIEIVYIRLHWSPSGERPER